MQKFGSWLFAAALACLVVVGYASAADKPDSKAGKKAPSVEEQFNKMDKNGDGKLSLEEFIGKKDGEAKTKAEAMFKKMDADGDGFVTLDEFKAFRAKAAKHGKAKKEPAPAQ